MARDMTIQELRVRSGRDCPFFCDSRIPCFCDDMGDDCTDVIISGISRTNDPTEGDVLNHRTCAWICAAVLSLGLSHLARAEEPATHFPVGAFALTLEADYAHSVAQSRARIESGAIGIGYYFIDKISINVEFAGFAVQQSGPESTIAEGNLLIRHHLYESGKFSFFVDVGGGISYADTRTPAGGTNYNYVLQTGVGTTYELRHNLYFMGGTRYWHLSNADIEGKRRNPSINALEGYVGLMWML